MNNLITVNSIDPNLVAAAKHRAAAFVRDHRPQGLGVDEVTDDILLEFYRRRDVLNAAAEAGDAVKLGDTLEEAVNVAYNKAINESRKHIRRLVPFQVRNAEKYLADRILTDLAHDMADYFQAATHRENDRRRVRLTILRLALPDRLVANAYLELLSWQKVARRFGMSEGHFRRHVLPDFIAHFKEEWEK